MQRRDRCPASLTALVTQAFDELGVSFVRLRTWLNLQPPETGSGYSPGYPHVHHDTSATTIVLYLSADPSPLDILEDGEVVETIKPELGDMVCIPNGVWHAVHRNLSNENRVAAIVTAYPN